MTLAQQIVVLYDGQIQQVGTPEEVYHFPANRMVAGFLGNPPMNLLPAKYAEGYFYCGEQYLPVTEAIAKTTILNEQDKFFLGIRPEAIRVGDAVSHQETAQLKLKVELVEPLGRETLLRAQVLGTDESINFLVSGIWQGQLHETLSVAVDINQLFVFQESQGDRIYPKN
jgi:multiple sugar transport system ATP-binding protein